MANYAYLRVSTHAQDVENQKLSVLDYCNAQGIAPIEFVEDTTSGRRSWRDREIGPLLEIIWKLKSTSSIYTTGEPLNGESLSRRSGIRWRV